MKKNSGITTKCVHSGDLIDDNYNGAITPVYPTTAYSYLDVEEYKYPRYFNTPSQLALSKKLLN